MKSVHYSTGQTPAMLRKGWTPRLPADTLRKDFLKIHPTASSFNIMLYKVKHHEKQRINDYFEYSKQNSNEVPDLKVGDLVLVSTLNFPNIKGLRKLKYSYLETFVIVSLH
ncbi:hypothetical protein O181_009728 [Austropuccinia psidii MF-1]|uniref:Uncharacterized protein n=1 Tax=Austropuccinia psidii MF-1 TaxID=1389203 RepID=A0A9Q3BRL6_9BASI|nr:hypothetical protein [Austropuccinia psidii MF-1]